MDLHGVNEKQDGLVKGHRVTHELRDKMDVHGVSGPSSLVC